MMDDFDDNDLDNLVDHHDIDDDVNEYLEQQDSKDQIENDEEKRIVPIKIRVKRSQSLLNPEKLRGPRGLSILPTWFENIQLKGKGYELEDINAVVNRLEQWTHRLYPRFTFDDAIAKLEKLGKKNEVKVILKRIRMGMDDFVSQTDDDVVESHVTPTQDDLFDKIASSTDIFPVTSTPSVRNSGLTEEQRQRMMHNRMLAEERRQAKIKARREQELNDSLSFNVNTTTIDSNI